MTVSVSEPLDILETFRVPCTVEGVRAGGLGHVRSPGGAELLWLASARQRTPTRFRLGGSTLFGAVASGEDVQRAQDESGRDWHASDELVDDDGNSVGAVWRASDGSALLPFDPNQIVRVLLREEYANGGAESRARTVYYRVRPLLPRRVQMAARRRFARRQERVTFPAWPVESSLHDFYAYVLRLVEEAFGSPLPWIAPWPVPYRWSVVLTHDVEREVGYRHLDAVAALERRAGARSAWYFVPERDYRVDDHVVSGLVRDGFEVCLHGLRHDGRDLSPGVFEERLPAMRSYASQWGAVGFRAPATQREWDRVAALGFEHDSSYSDVARYEPQSGGSCSWLPFFVGDTVELPITLPMDHTLFELLHHDDGGVWFEKSRFLRERGGLALLLTHPDYLLDPERLREYERFLAFATAEDEAWLALPRDVASWWRRRQASTIGLVGGTWKVQGPAAGDARVVLGVPAAG